VILTPKRRLIPPREERKSMLVESICFELKSSFSDEGVPPEQFDLLSAFSRPLNLDIRTVDRQELIKAFSKDVTMPSWLTLENVALSQLPLESISLIARLEYVIDDVNTSYSEEKVKEFCDHLLWVLSSQEKALAVRYFISSRRAASK
jgi:hypothetical protein